MFVYLSAYVIAKPLDNSKTDKVTIHDGLKYLSKWSKYSYLSVHVQYLAIHLLHIGVHVHAFITMYIYKMGFLIENSLFVGLVLRLLSLFGSCFFKINQRWRSLGFFGERK